MTQINNGGPAFPRSPFDINDYTGDGSAGMTLRDWVMGQCIAAAFASPDVTLKLFAGETIQDARRRYWGEMAKTAAIAADAMIAERAKP